MTEERFCFVDQHILFSHTVQCRIGWGDPERCFMDHHIMAGIYTAGIITGIHTHKQYNQIR